MNEVAKALRWIVNQIPEFKPKTNEEKLIQTIRSYCSAGADEIDRLEKISESNKLKTLSKMGFNIYSKYKIKFTTTYTYESECYDDCYPNRTEESEFIIDGGQFVNEFLIKSLKNRYFSDLGFDENKILISFFDPTSGHYTNEIYELEEIKE